MGVCQMRDFRHIELELEGEDALEYEIVCERIPRVDDRRSNAGDALDIFPSNDAAAAQALLEDCGLEPKVLDPREIFLRREKYGIVSTPGVLHLTDTSPLRAVVEVAVKAAAPSTCYAKRVWPPAEMTLLDLFVF
eukprot:9502810-Pyramimonas_sp.AAC.3